MFNFLANFLFPETTIVLPVMPAPEIRKNNLLLTLHSAARLAQLQLKYTDTIRLAVMDAESTVQDLLQCLEGNPHSKPAKRIARLQCLVKFFGHELSQETHERMHRVLTAMEAAENVVVEEAPKPSNYELLEQLRASLAMDPDEAADGLVFDKLPIDGEYKPPVKQPFHDACKDVVNCDGNVYDIFTAVAIIAFEELLRNSHMRCPLRALLMSKAKLVFKGGAATGKFLFMANTELWNSMTPSDREFVKRTFVNKGDNDTGLVFKVPKECGYSVSEANAMIGQILFDMNRIVLEVTRRFNVERIILPYMDAHFGTHFEFAGRQFAFTARQARSFSITEKNERQNELLVLEEESHRLFTSMSLLEFRNAKGGMVKFYLSRVKAAFKARDADGLEVNCYAECLDISATCVDSTKVEATYKPVVYKP